MAFDSIGVITNVAVAGASGSLGSAVVDALLESNKFVVTMLSRNQPTHVRPNVKIALIDYDDQKSLQQALADQDAVVSTLAREATLHQIALIDAAAVVGVKRFIPSEFGANLQNPNSRRLINYRAKVKVEEYLEQKAKGSRLTYTFIYTNALIDWSIKAGIILDIKNAKACLYNGGETPVSMITLPSAALAVANSLLKYNDTKNRPVYVHGIVMSQKELLNHAKEALPELQWAEEVVDLDKLEEEARQNQQVKQVNMTLFHVGAMKAGFAAGFGNRFEDADCKLLGVPSMSKEDVIALVQELAKNGTSA